jgi:hypothetical protein
MAAPIREYLQPDDATLRAAVIGSGEPAVLRGLASAWPAVARARVSAQELIQYLQGFDNGAPVDAVMTPPEAQGRVFYNEGMTGFNYLRNRLPLTQVAEQVLRYAAFPNPPAVAVQSALIRDCLPGFSQANGLSVLEAGVLPRIWFGNRITTPTHFDEWNNIGCVVCGRRRFTLFPPDQVVNLYVGPLDFAPTGAPVSLVTLSAPDLERFPRFRTALAAARSAELAPGDAIYIPPLWWHHVESLESFNVLVNYWWHASGGLAQEAPSGFDALLHAILNLRELPPADRAAWRALFDRYVFGPQDEVTAHIPAHRHGLLGPLSAQDVAALRAGLAQRLKA